MHAVVILMMDMRLQLLQRDVFLRLLDRHRRRRVQELRIALCHFLRYHLFLSLSSRGSGTAESQEIVQLRMLRLLLQLMTMTLLLGMLLMLMIMEHAIVHAGDLACGDHRVIILDDAVAAGVRQ